MDQWQENINNVQYLVLLSIGMIVAFCFYQLSFTSILSFRYCDLLAEVVFILWAAELRLWLAPWLLIIFALELGSAFIDTTNVATGCRWRDFAPTHGIVFRVLNVVYPNGHYNRWGTTLWIVYATWISCHLLLAHTPADYSHLTTFLYGFSLILSPAVIGYILHQLVYLIVLISGWKEPPHGFID